MKKRFTGILMCMMMFCMSILAGCSLVEPNYNDYYNQAVAVVEYKKTGEQYEITKKDLISAYQSYGYSYEQYYGYTREEALKETLTLLENRKITLLTAEEKFGINQNGDGLSEKEKTYLYQQAIDSLNDNLKNYYIKKSNKILIIGLYYNNVFLLTILFFFYRLILNPQRKLRY